MEYIDEINTDGKTIILRSDLNVPIQNKKIIDNFKIKKSLKTINYLLEKNCKIILLSHLGKVKTEEDKKNNSLKIVYKELKKQINAKVFFSKELVGTKFEKKVKNLKQKQILLLENTRFMDLDNKKESNCDLSLSKYWASFADLFVMDAFGSSHRKHTSTYGVGKFLPTSYGLLIKEETNALNEALQNDKKIVILGGAKIEDKLNLVKNLLPKSQKILIGGKMCATFLYLKGNKVKKSQVNLEVTESLNKLYKDNVNKLIIPIDIKTNNTENIKVENLKEEEIFDIGKNTIELFKQNINKEDFVVWNGPLGLVENKNYEVGTIEILNYLKQNDIKTIIAGGDTAAVANKYNMKFYHISTGGGATLEFLEGKELPALTLRMEVNNEENNI